MSNGSNSTGRVDSADPVEVHAPFAGVVHLQVDPMQSVMVGDTVAVVEAVKLEAPVQAPCAGVVLNVNVEAFADVTGGDRLMTIAPSTPGATAEEGDNN